MRPLVVASLLALLLLLLLSGVAWAHALPVRSDPAENAILDQAPSQIRIWFTEEVNPTLTKIVVVDKDNHEVDLQDTHVSSADPREADVSIRPLSPGVYVVIWRAVSAEDGHASGGNFYFRVRFPDGSVPGLPSELPSGPAGFANTSGGQCLAGSSPLLCLPEVFSEWLVYLATAIWVGGMFWQAYMVERAAQQDRSLASVAIATARRFRSLVTGALGVFLIANIGYIIGQSMLLGGSWASGFSPTLWAGSILHSSFGTFWLLRGLIVLLALLLLTLFPEPVVAEEQWHPRQFLNWVRIVLGLLLLVALAFSGHAAAAQANGTIGPFAIPVDWLHLLAMSLWVGGLLFIALVLMPAIWHAESIQRGQALVKLLPRFSIIAIASVFTAAVTGSLNADVQMSSWDQFLGTTYGRTLIVKILLFIVMMGISAYHAFRVRPQLSRELSAWAGEHVPVVAGAGAQDGASVTEVDQEERAQVLQEKAAETTRWQRARLAFRTHAAAQASAARLEKPEIHEANGTGASSISGAEAVTVGKQAGEPKTASEDGIEGHQQQRGAPSSGVLGRVERLSGQLRTWIQREAALGVAVLFCAALLGGLAGSLTPTLPGAPNVNAPTLTATSKAPVDLTQTKEGLRVTLKVSPDKFGTNSFGVLVVDAATGKPIDGANVHLLINMLDMDMGTGTSDLKGVGGGFYIGQGDLLMGGRWQVTVQVRTPQDPTTIHRLSFDFTVSFS